MTETVKTKIDSAGLRYVSKPAGSPFAPKDSFSSQTMSCFLCGVHRPRAALRTRKMFGKWHHICDSGCKPTGERAASTTSD